MAQTQGQTVGADTAQQTQGRLVPVSGASSEVARMQRRVDQLWQENEVLMDMSSALRCVCVFE